jgi:transcriptional/translational regulatory protein YebC/TACO1
MVRRDGAETRKERYAKIAQTIQQLLFKAKEQGLNYIPLRRTVIGFKVEMGLTFEKIIEYMTDLEELDQFVMDNERNQIRKSM